MKKLNILFVFFSMPIIAFEGDFAGRLRATALTTDPEWNERLQAFRRHMLNSTDLHHNISLFPITEGIHRSKIIHEENASRDQINEIYDEISKHRKELRKERTTIQDGLYSHFRALRLTSPCPHSGNIFHESENKAFEKFALNILNSSD